MRPVSNRAVTVDDLGRKLRSWSWEGLLRLRQELRKPYGFRVLGSGCMMSFSLTSLLRILGLLPYRFCTTLSWDTAKVGRVFRALRWDACFTLLGLHLPSLFLLACRSGMVLDFQAFGDCCCCPRSYTAQAGKLLFLASWGE